tara:strand:- start:1113 stop:1835 length:723 start_codon:yes stop_codon:yes gene_type:complete
MASVLDYLLPKSFMSDVQTTFRPKSFNRLQASEFTPGFHDPTPFEKYGFWMDEGQAPTQEAYRMFSEGSETERERLAKASGFTGSEGVMNYLKALVDPQSDFFGFKSKENLQPDVNIFGGQSLAEGFERSGVYDFDPAMAKPMQLSTLRDIDPGSYSKEVATKRGTLADSLSRQRAKASQIGGGFAGYGSRAVAQDLAEQQFAQGSQGIMEDVNKQRADALQQLYSELEGYGSIIGEMNQ